MRWIPIVHQDTVTLGVARFDGEKPLDVHWVGRVEHSISPERWQQLLAMLVPEHRGTGEGWFVRAAQEGVRGLAGTLFGEVLVEAAREAPPGPDQARLAALRASDPEAAELVERTLKLERDLRDRIVELRVTYTSVEALAAAIERTLSEYDRAILATAIDTPDLPQWCRAVAEQWWENEAVLRAPS